MCENMPVQISSPMASKVFAFISLLCLLGICVAQNAWEGCVWADLNTSDCDAAACPADTVEVTTGKAGACYPDERDICKKGRRKLCCPSGSQMRNCKWLGTAPFCITENCPKGQMAIGQDGWGGGKYCISGCKLYCCDNNN